MIPTLAGVLSDSRQLGFLGPAPVEDHVAHALAFVHALEHAPARALDLGAGGGLPGLVLAAEAWPATEWCLLDAQQRRTEFLADAVARLRLSRRVQVVHARAEDHGRQDGERHGFDAVVARSFGPPAVVAECAAPLLRPGGFLVVSEPPASSPRTRWPADGLDQFGLGDRTELEVEGPQPVHLVRLAAERLVDDRYPRRPGVPAKRPLF